jgi:uncharacterized protein (DUF305 family)
MGMMTDDEMAELEAAEGDEFDRLFLEHMIEHHEGAIVMSQRVLEAARTRRSRGWRRP